MFKATFKSIDEHVEAEGETVLEAFNALKIENKKMVRASLRVEKGDKYIERVLNGATARRFTNNPLTRGIWAKLLSTRF